MSYLTESHTMSSPLLRQSLDPLASNLGLVFTDARGRVVFGDTHFLDLIGPERGDALVGQPLHKVMGADHQVVSGLISDIGRSGYVRDQRVTITNKHGVQVVVACSGIATYDEQGGFIGVDLTLRDPEHTALASMMFDSHSDVLNARIQQIEFESQSQGAEQTSALVNLYFTAQVSAVEVLLGRMGGPRMVEALEALLNRSATSHQWPIQLKGGRFVVDVIRAPSEAFRVLLAEVFEFAANIMGQRAIRDEMKLVDSNMKPDTQATAGQAGLRDFVS